LVALDCQCIFRQALLYLESNDAVESAELVVGTAESPFVADGNRSIQNIDLITCNIEGAKSNNVFLQKVAKEKSVLCI
jgi:hypothetical protein